MPYFDLSILQWVLVGLCGLAIGLSKTGLSGAGLFVVPVMAAVFGGRPSTGLLLPMLIMADAFAVWYYNRHAEWKHVFRLLPWAIAGVILATLTGNMIKGETFTLFISITVLVSIVLIVWSDISKRKNQKVPEHWIFSALIGIAGGFATMIGNAAGPIFSIYLLSMHLPKNNFIGTRAWFFFIINLFKVPLHIFAWQTITWQTLLFDFSVLPAIIVGVVLGIFIVKKIPEQAYRLIVIVTIIIAAGLMLFR